jgi:preprotein translocase subunit SecD
MNKYPSWLNLLVLVVLLAGILFAMPNLYGTSPALQLAPKDGLELPQNRLDEFVRVVGNQDIAVEAAYLDDGRGVIRFPGDDEQAQANELLRANYESQFTVAQTQAPRLPEWVRSLGLDPMSLGLDLRGGVYVLLEVDMDTAISNRMGFYQQDFSDRLADNDIARRVEDPSNGVINVRLQSEEDRDRAREIIRASDPDILITDGADGRSLRIRMTDAQIDARQNFAIEQNITTLRNRVNELGVSEPIVQRQGADRIVVQLPGVQDPAELDKILTATATLEFRLQDQSGDEPGSRRYPGRGTEPAAILKRKVIVSGDQIIDAGSTFSEGQPVVTIKLDAAGGEEMLVTTQNNLRKPMCALYIETERETYVRDGERRQRTVKTEEIINCATIQGVFKSNFQISGLSPIEARDLALLLRAGALAAPVYKIDERTIGPTLGKENIEKGFKAITIGFLAVIVFMAIYYKWFGMIANIALFSNLVFIVALLSMLQASLTLPGIAGIVLTVGMAVDANVLIFERIREEIVAGIKPQAAIDSGYEKALSSIADANITTLIAAIVLFAFGTGPIKGFAITLSLGIITSMFTAIVGTRAVVNLAFGGRRIESLPV